MLTLDGSGVNRALDSLLAPYAQHNEASLGRAHSEVPDALRGPYQRDRNRIVHSAAFRRLRGKMQVMPPDFGDHFRTRLTHTIEVTSISRDLARVLRLNEDLAEAIALSHDLGHSPFGHAGEAALNDALRGYGLTFEHNQQSLRIVTEFIQHYPDFNGLNLTHELLDGLKKHASVPPTAEAQLVDIADEIAYTSADLEDGLRGGFFAWNDVAKLPIMQVLFAHQDADNLIRSGHIRLVVGGLMRALIHETERRLAVYGIYSQQGIAHAPVRMVAFSADFAPLFAQFKAFLFQHYYNAPQIKQQTQHGQLVIADLFTHYMTHPQHLPERQTSQALAQRTADYIAGMTDAFALDQHARYCDPR